VFFFPRVFSGEENPTGCGFNSIFRWFQLSTPNPPYVLNGGTEVGVSVNLLKHQSTRKKYRSGDSGGNYRYTSGDHGGKDKEIIGNITL